MGTLSIDPPACFCLTTPVDVLGSVTLLGGPLLMSALAPYVPLETVGLSALPVPWAALAPCWAS